jgi:Mu transposase, C-terminal domain
MVTDQQVRRLLKLTQTEKTQAIAAAKAGMDRKTARKYLRSGKLPSERVSARTWRTRTDPFDEVWARVRQQLELNPGLEAKTLFQWLQREHPGRFQDGQLRTLQRRIKAWRATEGPAKEVFFAQVHRPGELCQSDFTHMTKVGVTIAGRPFDHLVYHFVLTYSNWEDATVCFSESFESLSEGVQNALWKLGSAPKAHRSDQLSAAVNRLPNPDAFTRRYQGLLEHYGLAGQKTQAGHANENGDVEQRHHRFKQAMDQALMLRGSRDFADRAEYESFLSELIDQLNAGRRERLQEELAVMRELPDRRTEACRHLRGVRVHSGSLIHVDRNVYSVNSRLIGEQVNVRLHAERVEVFYGQRKVEEMPRLRGRGKHRINYRHVIDWLIRKPGAFENYRYRDELFPTARFRMAYDAFKQRYREGAAKHYLEILHLAAHENETAVDEALRQLIHAGQVIDVDAVQRLLRAEERLAPARTEVMVASVDPSSYDALYGDQEAA